MFTAMIIDDERIVREGIRELIDWEKAGFRLGSDGKDGRGGWPIFSERIRIWFWWILRCLA